MFNIDLYAFYTVTARVKWKRKAPAKMRCFGLHRGRWTVKWKVIRVVVRKRKLSIPIAIRNISHASIARVYSLCVCICAFDILSVCVYTIWFVQNENHPQGHTHTHTNTDIYMYTTHIQVHLWWLCELKVCKCWLKKVFPIDSRTIVWIHIRFVKTSIPNIRHTTTTHT